MTPAAGATARVAVLSGVADGVTSSAGALPDAVGLAVAALAGIDVSRAIPANIAPAAGWANSTSLGSGGQVVTGAVTNCTSLAARPCRLEPSDTRSDVVMPESTVRFGARSLATFSSLNGLPSSPLCRMPLTIWADMNWSRWMRCRSEPSPMSSRVRQNASAVTPSMCCSPAATFSPDTRSLTANGTHTVTPPRSLTTLTNPAMPISMKWSMRMPVCCSTVFHRQDGPPAASTALIRS